MKVTPSSWSPALEAAVCRDGTGRNQGDPEAFAEQTFRRLAAPELLAEGVTYVNGVRVKSSPEAAA